MYAPAFSLHVSLPSSAETDAGTLCLGAGGARLAMDGAERDVGPEREYPEIYARFARLIREDRSDVDRAPLRLVADAFLRCRRIGVATFEDCQPRACMSVSDIQKWERCCYFVKTDQECVV